MPTLEWIGKDKVVNHHQEVPFRILDKKYTFNAENSENMIIHGDNLLALKSLLPQYEGRVDCIYIDPPYNTGNEKWVYNDNVNDPYIKKWLGEVVGQEGEDLSRHDKWLCMMYPRLKLLHKLLSDRGAIFISIDDNEQANLKLICDEIFGKSNFVTQIIWEKVHTRKNSAINFSSSHEYILVYAKIKRTNANDTIGFKRNLLPREDTSAYKNPDNDPKGPWKTDPITAHNPYSADYTITKPNGVVIKKPDDRYWAYSKETIDELIANKAIVWGESDSMPMAKRYLADVQDGLVPVTLFSREFAGDTSLAKKVIDSVLDKKGLFEYPKPPKLIERILQIATNKDSIILDSFAGSGTTAHAVLDLNKQDGGNRKFILVEMMDYADTITAERVKRVINGYGKDDKAVAGIPGDFTYYELGQPLFKDDKNLNEEVPEEEIRKYVYYMETKKPLDIVATDNPYLLGKNNDTAYYFYYKKDQITTLNHEFLSMINTKATEYVIYADKCVLAQEIMEKFNIVFKKIPRDITRL